MIASTNALRTTRVQELARKADCANDIEFLRQQARSCNVDEQTTNAHIAAYKAARAEGKDYEPFFVIPFERKVGAGTAAKRAGEAEPPSKRLSKRERKRLERKRGSAARGH